MFKELFTEAAWTSAQKEEIETLLEGWFGVFRITKFKNYPQKVYITFQDGAIEKVEDFIKTGKAPKTYGTYIKNERSLPSFFIKGDLKNKWDVKWNIKGDTLEILYKFDKSPEGRLAHLSGPLYRSQLAKLKGDITEARD